MSTLFITGVTGFAGTNLVKYFASRGGVTLAAHSRNPDHVHEIFKGITLGVAADTSAASFDAFATETVVHLAGIAHDLSNTFTEKDYVDVNFENTKRVYDSFLASSATKFIFLSSIKAAVKNSSVPATEEIIAQSDTAYGRSKRMAEEYILSTPLPPGKSYYIFRPCMIHGAGNKGNLNLLYRFVKSGIPWPLGSFHNQRSFLNVDNLNFIVDQFHHHTFPSGIYHLADEGALSTNELFDIIATTLDKPVRILKIPKAVMTPLFTVLGRSAMLGKLTEDMLVSNKKLLSVMQTALPVSIRDGVAKTIRSFHE